MNFSLGMRRVLAPIAIMLAVAACGGGGGGGGGVTSNPPPPPVDPGDGTGAIDRGGVAVGPIDGFGSVIVNGVRFSTDNAIIMIDGAPANEADLAVGQVVLVVGTFNDDGLTGTADRIDYDENVEGPIEDGSLDLAAQTFRVLGQDVLVTPTTSFDDNIQPPSIEALVAGDIVEVSGLTDASGRIVATRIERSSSNDDEFEVTGTVASLDDLAMTFMINDLVVDYSAAQLDDFPSGTISNGDLVEAEGSTISPSGVLLATQIESRDDLDASGAGDDGDDVEVEGLITALRSQSDFDIGSIRVLTTSATNYEGGNAADLALNVRVEADGQFDADGAIVASKIEFETEDDLEIEAAVVTVDTTAGTLGLMGTTAMTTVETRFEDKLNDIHMFGLDDINAGDFVEVRGYVEGNQFVASRIERDDPDDSYLIQGPASNVVAPGFTILGTSVLTSGETQFEDENENPIDAGSFFDSADGRNVRASGIWDGAMLLADEVSFEDD